MTSTICNTLVGPSVVTRTDSNPDPGRDFNLWTASSIGITPLLTIGHGPSIASAPANNDVINLSLTLNTK